MALWSAKTVQVTGLTSVYANSGPITAENKRHYILDTFANTIIVNLPTGMDGQIIRISDAKGTFGTNHVHVFPATGQKINNLATNEELILNANEMWIEFTWNASAGTWIVNAPGILALIADSFSDYPYILSPDAPEPSTLRLYAKSDGKLYTKNSAGTEKIVGGGLEHPTGNSTFEVDGYNLAMTGTNNTGIGVGAGDSITSGIKNTVYGQQSGTAITTGSDNTGQGAGSLYQLTSGSYNTAVGADSFYWLSSGIYNVAIGAGAGDQLTTGNHNTFINAGTVTNVSGVVVIGRDNTGSAPFPSVDNQFILGTANHLYRLPGVVETALVLGPYGILSGQTGTLKLKELSANGNNSVEIKAPDALASDISLILPDSTGIPGQLLSTDGSGNLSWQTVSTDKSAKIITQSSHGFVAADVGRPLYLNGSTYELAKADTEATAEVAGLISRVIDVDSFEICLGGEVSSVGASLVEGGGSLTTGEVYFLSATTAGTITTTAPTVVGQIAKPVGIARTTTALDFFNMRGNAVGGSNVYTQIGLANNATTTIQNASAYDSVELAGWVYINATTDLRFHFKAQVTKKGDGTDYLVSFQTSGDTPPSGFDIDATSGGLVQVVMPSVAGFTSAIAQFSLNGPAVGASLPLQIESNLINYSQSPSYRNKIINGDMRIYQRGSLDTPITNTRSTYVLDRFWVNPSGGSITISQKSAAGEVGLPSEFSYYQKLVVNTGDNYAGVVQTVEDARTLAGQTATFSFWAKGTNPGAGQFSVRIYVEHDSQTTDVDYQQFMVITSSWKKYSFTYNLAEIAPGAILGSNSHLKVAIEQPGTDTSTAAWTLDTTGWQLEAGSVATPFEHRPIGLELSLCQRYYQRYKDGTNFGGGFYNSVSDLFVPIVLPVVMRTFPSLSYSSLADLDIEPFDVQPTILTMDGNEACVRLYVVDPGTRVMGYSGTLYIDTINGWIAFNAEL